MTTGVLVLGFGGPTPGCCRRRETCPQTPACEAECFVAGILGDNPARKRRVDEVAGHYHHLGGFSPYNRLTAAQADALAAELARRGQALPVACGFRHWTPWTIDGLRELAARGCDEVVLLVAAPHQSSVSWDWYLKHAAEAAEKLGSAAPKLVGVVEPWWRSDGFVAALCGRITEAVAGWVPGRFAAAELIFTAHAVPAPVAQTSQYCQQFAESAALAAAACGHPRHTVAYQSAPEDSRVAWTGPDIVPVIEAAHAAGVRDVVAISAGFLVDHTEVLYDLDVVAADRARELGIGFLRAPCVHDHPAFINALADGVERALAGAAARR